MGKRFRPALTLFMTVALACSTALCRGGGAKWHLQGWPCRKVLEVRSKAPEACMDVYIGTRATRDGHDLRVVSHKSRPMKLRIVHSTPEGRFLIVFETSDGPGAYYLYSGRALASAPAKWEPKTGLVLEIRTRAEGQCDSWENMKKMIEASTEVQGRAFRDRIFDGFNPFGPPDDYISIYRGRLKITKPGLYTFSTMSDEASFMFINGRMVCQWPGRHESAPGRRGRFQGKIRLDRGLQKIDYYHVEYDGAQSAAAAWAPPGARGAQLIPASAFALPAKAQLLHTELKGESLTADFQYENRNYLELGRGKMTAVAFSFTGSSDGDRLPRCKWNFGDGTYGGGIKARHVYTAPGVYTVRLQAMSATRKISSFQTRIRVKPVWSDLDFRLPKMKAFRKAVLKYPFDKLSPPNQAGAMYLYRDSQYDEELLAICQALYPQRQQLDPLDQYELLLTLAELNLRNPDEAVRLYHQALPLVKKDKTKLLDLEMKIADALFYYKRDYKGAAEAYKSIRKRYAGSSSVTLRIALIRIGDVYREEGNAEEARKIYNEAEQHPSFKPKLPKAILSGGYVTAVLEKLRNNKAKDALEFMDKWEWEL